LRRRFGDAAHLVLLGLVFLAGLAAFLVLRAAVVPESFGRFGHYRATALDDNRARPLSFGGQQSCAGCHSDVVEQREKGGHRRVSCEACHGPLASHAGDPTAVRPPALKVSPLCGSCHESDAAKPVKFPQVTAQEHSGGAECHSCHQPHQPAP
jgi:uncharacterized CHY-type Zn-finger protein